jgi:hypothetical protein
MYYYSKRLVYPSDRHEYRQDPRSLMAVIFAVKPFGRTPAGARRGPRLRDTADAALSRKSRQAGNWLYVGACAARA